MMHAVCLTPSWPRGDESRVVYDDHDDCFFLENYERSIRIPASDLYKINADRNADITTTRQASWLLEWRKVQQEDGYVAVPKRKDRRKAQLLLLGESK